MPRLQLKLFGPFRDYLPNKGDEGGEVDLTSVRTVQDLLAHLDIPAEDPKVVMVNGLYEDLDTLLEDGDSVCVFPPIAGG